MNGKRGRIWCYLTAALVWPSLALAGASLDVVAHGNGYDLTYGGNVFHTTASAVQDLRLIAVPNQPTTVALWTEQQADGRQTPFYAVSLDGQTVNRVFETNYRITTRYAAFDPMVENPAIPAGLAADAGNTIYVVQFWAQPLGVFQDALGELGVPVHAFLGSNAVVAEMTPATVAAVQQLPFVRWVGPLHPVYKLDEALLQQLNQPVGDNAKVEEPFQYFSIMAFRRGPLAQKAIAAQIRATGGMVMNIAPDGFRMTVTAQLSQMLAVARMNETQFIDPWGPGETDMDIIRQLDGAVPTLQNAGFTGQGVRGEVFDTEVDSTHPQWNGQAPLIHGPNGNSGTHGSSCYGICFSTGVANAQATGLCPDREQGIFCWYENSSQFGGPFTRLQLNTEATDPNGPYRSVFQTSSVGSPRTTQYTTISAETDDYLFQVDYLSCQSMSNAGLTPDTRPQAWAKNIIGVGGINHGSSLTRTTHSAAGSTGPASDNRIKPDLANAYDDIFTTTSSGGHTQFGGTSGATPCTAGAFGLLFQMWHEEVFQGFGGGNSVFESRCKSTTAKALGINTAYRYPISQIARDRTQGWGWIDLAKLYTERDKIYIVDETDLLTPLAVNRYVLTVQAGEPEFAATLVYIDPAGNPANQSQHRINDLSLKVTAPDSTVYWGNNGLRADNWSTAGGAPNTKDTVENVFVQNPEAGGWIVEVFGDEIVQDSHVETPALDADYALVVRGVTPCSSAGTMNLDRAFYACESTATLRVVDCDINTDPNVVETITVTIDSTSEPAGEAVVLTETGNDSPLFEGTIDLSETNSIGVLWVAHGDTVTATYIDANNGSGGFNVPVTDTAGVDCADPIISNVQAINLEPRSADITFDADELVRARVHYGTSCGQLNNTAANPMFSMSPVIGLTGLTDETTYYFAVEAEDQSGNVTYDDNNGQCYTFTTPDVPDFFTELFASGNDLDNLMLTFTPNGSNDFYRGCVESISALPTDPAGGTMLPLSDDDFEQIFVSGNTVALYGQTYASCYVGSNGYITFLRGETDYTESLEDHFNQPRISALFDDLNPSAGGQVSYKQLPDRMAVTWLNVPEYSTSNSNTFQVEMFFDGTVRVSYLAIAADDGLAGLSDGSGYDPTLFFPSDLSAMGPCTTPGDMNCDGFVDNEDIDPFVLAVTQGQAAYQAAWPNCDYFNGDINGDGFVDNEDIDPFVALITGP